MLVNLAFCVFSMNFKNAIPISLAFSRFAVFQKTKELEQFFKK
jgi:hypothetical protein